MLQVTLVDRSKRSVVLTPVGVETVERARKIVKEVEDLVSYATASREPLSGTLRMAPFQPSAHFCYRACCRVFVKLTAASSSILWRT